MVFPPCPAEVNAWSVNLQNGNHLHGNQCILDNGMNVSQASHAAIEDFHFQTLDMTSVGELCPPSQEKTQINGCIICTTLFDVQWGLCIPENH